MASQSVGKLTEEQYLALERAAEYKSEYFDGEMFAMSGASMQHGRLQRNITAEFYNPLRDGACEPFGSDLKVRVSNRIYTYPDVSVVCGKPMLADDQHDVLLNPVVIVEIPSSSTEKYDRGLKLKHYRTVATLQDYILVDQREVAIEQYTRQENNLWTLLDYLSLDDQLAIKSIDVSIPLRRIYDRVEFLSN